MDGTFPLMWWVGGASVAVAVVVSYLVNSYLKAAARADQLKKKGKKTRRMSFNSSVMVSGGFPPAASVWPPIINAMFLVKECPTNVSLIAACKKLIHFPRFQSKVEHDGEHWNFVECDLNFADHIKTVAVASEAEVLAEADRIATTDLDRDIPLWCMHRITNKVRDLSLPLALGASLL
jgi:hypothetical protein